jgi:A/G-specific adenine glycosylase
VTEAAGKDFAERVVAWHARHGRSRLPWQCPATAYRVWISEVMLQQTRVETVIPYFERFMVRFPDLATLAAADTDAVLAHWSGLGYYARARNLHRAAQTCVSEHGGELPDDRAALEALPGVGRSTAGAIQSLARGRHAAILDGNVKRVLARHAGIEGWPGRTPVQRELWALAGERTPADAVATYNQALMDLGATVCLRRPRCGVCPVASDCRAHHDGTTDRIPAPKPKKAIPRREVAVLVLQRPDDGAILLERRAPTGIWGGLWSLPEFADHTALADWLERHVGAVDPEPLAPVDHTFTHFRLRMHPYRVPAGAPHAVADGGTQDWCTPAVRPGGVPAPVAKLLTQLTGAALA